MPNSYISLENASVRLTLVGEAETFLLYTLQSSGRTFRIGGPVFEVDGVRLPVVVPALAELTQPRVLTNGCTEYRYGGALASCEEVSLEIILRVAKSGPVLRLAYVLHSRGIHQLTKSQGCDALTYLETPLAEFPLVTEVQCSEFIGLVHSYCLAEHEIPSAHFSQSLTLMGPILLGSDQSHTPLLAYEHGSQVPDAFVHFQLPPERTVTLQSVKGNYLHAQPLDKEV